MSELPANKATYIITTNLHEQSRDLIEICALYGELTEQSSSNYAEKVIVNKWTNKVVSKEKFTQIKQSIKKDNHLLTFPVSRYHQAQTLLPDLIINSLVSKTISIQTEHPITKQILVGIQLDNSIHTISFSGDKLQVIHFNRNKSEHQESIKGTPNVSGITLGYIKHVASRSEIVHIKPNTILAGSYRTLKDVELSHVNGLIIYEDPHKMHLNKVKFRGTKIIAKPNSLKHIPNGAYVSINAPKGLVQVINKTVKSKPTKDTSPKMKFYVDIAGNTEIDISSQYGYSFLNSTKLVGEIIKTHKTGSYTDALVNYLTKDLKLSSAKPIIYQSLCVSVNTKGLFGKHGAQYISEHPDFFIEELEAIHQLLYLYNFSNITLTIPFVRTVKELESIKKIITKNKLTRSSRFKLFITIQVPANILQLAEYIDLGLDGVIIDLQCLTDLTMGIDSHLFRKNYSKAEHTYEFMNDTFKFLRFSGVCHLEDVLKSYNKLEPSIRKILNHCQEISKKRHSPLLIYIPDNYEESIEKELRKQVKLGLPKSHLIHSYNI